jgi:hypothetical protein
VLITLLAIKNGKREGTIVVRKLRVDVKTDAEYLPKFHI